MKAQPMTFYLPDTRGVEISRFGKGNRKIGADVYTYSRVPGRPDGPTDVSSALNGTCPGATDECLAICYAMRISGPVLQNYIRNADGIVPSIPEDARYVRIHVSGDFDSERYIHNWIMRVGENPRVHFWAYTKSWRVPALLPHLEVLRSFKNMQLFASMDASSRDLPPYGWRRAWIQRAEAKDGWPTEDRLSNYSASSDNLVAITEMTLAGIPHDGMFRTPAYVCPEETGRKPDCVSCGYCITGRKHDVVFLEH